MPSAYSSHVAVAAFSVYVEAWLRPLNNRNAYHRRHIALLVKHENAKLREMPPGAFLARFPWAMGFVTPHALGKMLGNGDGFADA